MAKQAGKQLKVVAVYKHNFCFTVDLEDEKGKLEGVQIGQDAGEHLKVGDLYDCDSKEFIHTEPAKLEELVIPPADLNAQTDPLQPAPPPAITESAPGPITLT